MKNILVATINHSTNEGERVKICLRREGEGFTWQSENGGDCCLGIASSIEDAKDRAIASWGADVWNLKASWIKKG